MTRSPAIPTNNINGGGGADTIDGDAGANACMVAMEMTC